MTSATYQFTGGNSECRLTKLRDLMALYNALKAMADAGEEVNRTTNHNTPASDAIGSVVQHLDAERDRLAEFISGLPPEAACSAEEDERRRSLIERWRAEFEPVPEPSGPDFTREARNRLLGTIGDLVREGMPVEDILRGFVLLKWEVVESAAGHDLDPRLRTIAHFDADRAGYPASAIAEYKARQSGNA